MCGFVGAVNVAAENVSEQIKKMNEMIIHRGPDDEGYFTDNYITMGFRRLSIIDLAGGHQPMSYADKRYWITFNGEVYNYLELREELKQKGYKFVTDSDTEVILAMYACYQEKCVSRLRGMFSFVIWDTQEKVLFAARDHFGIKPLYYADIDNGFYYASEGKAIHQVLKQKSIDLSALQDYFTFQFIPEPKTSLNQIKALLPGSYLIKKMNEPSVIKQYFHVEFKPEVKAEDKYIAELQEVLFDSVEKHMRADVTVGSFLSGGIDSTLVTAIAQKFNHNLETFSVGFANEGYSELDVVEETVNDLGVKNFSTIITPEEFMNEFTKFVWAMDDPLADPAAVPQYFVAREARKRVKVALTGEGADEFFGGYKIYHEPLSLKVFQYTKPFNKILNKMAKVFPEGMKGRSFVLRGTTPLKERYVGNAFIFDEKHKQEFLANYDGNHSFQKITGELYQRASQYDLITQMQYVDIHQWLNADLLHNADRTTMANSLELRTPFVDTAVFEVARKIPADLRIKNETTKYILRKAAQGIVPESILMRKKLGFPVPIRIWLKNEMYDWACQIIKESNTEAYLDKQYFLDLLEEHRQGIKDNSRKIWTALNFMVWYDLYMETN